MFSFRNLWLIVFFYYNMCLICLMHSLWIKVTNSFKQKLLTFWMLYPNFWMLNIHTDPLSLILLPKFNTCCFYVSLDEFSTCISKQNISYISFGNSQENRRDVLMQLTMWKHPATAIEAYNEPMPKKQDGKYTFMNMHALKKRVVHISLVWTEVHDWK